MSLFSRRFYKGNQYSLADEELENRNENASFSWSPKRPAGSHEQKARPLCCISELFLLSYPALMLVLQSSVLQGAELLCATAAGRVLVWLLLALLSVERAGRLSHPSADNSHPQGSANSIFQIPVVSGSVPDFFSSAGESLSPAVVLWGLLEYAKCSTVADPVSLVGSPARSGHQLLIHGFRFCSKNSLRA